MKKLVRVVCNNSTTYMFNINIIFIQKKCRSKIYFPLLLYDGKFSVLYNDTIIIINRGISASRDNYFGVVFYGIGYSALLVSMDIKNMVKKTLCLIKLVHVGSLFNNYWNKKKNWNKTNFWTVI